MMILLPEPSWITKARDPRDTRGYAQHIRASVRFTRDRLGSRWGFSVVNTETGERIAGDNGHASMELAFADAEFAVMAARASWMRGFGKKRLVR